MATSSLILRCLTIFSFINNIAALTGYQLEEEYSGSNFFDAFNFFTGADPTHGFVTYVSESAASQQGLISVRKDGVYMGVDSKTVLSSGGAGRNSVRIESKKTWTHGLFVADLSHMPGGACGSWPAMWTYGDNWPNNGEIDIIEGVNSRNYNLMSLHAGGTCSVSGTRQTGTLQSANCNNFANPVSVGCGVSDPRPISYGAGFNSNGGGIYAMEWTSSKIRVYFFPAGSAPTDIHGPNPDPSKWGTPVSNFEGSCDIDSHFRENKLVFDTTFCGDWAAAVWSSDATCAPKAATCTDYVAGNPSAFTDQYWLVKSISIYQLGNIASPASSSPPAVVKPAPSSRPPVGTTVPSSSAPLVAQPSSVVSQPPNPPAPATTPTSPITPPIAKPPSQPNGKPLAGVSPIFSKVSDFIQGIGGEGNCNPPPRPEPTYDPEYPDCGKGGKCPLTPAFTCMGNNGHLQNLIPTLPTPPSIIPAGQLLGVGSDGGIPNLDADFDEAKGRNQALVKQAVGWTTPARAVDQPAGTGSASHGIVAKPFYPDEAGNGNETAGSAASPTPVLNLGAASSSKGVAEFEGGAAAVVDGGLFVWGGVVVIGGLALM
ncbi:hypothetical protein DSL72_001546 [Monilinia vaccinii-corymbosi]|uniref:endo-1,3(4)-beta-glucanase n=1 Tax=Monilinia vaccinii-corymbosi TaxID=61207 RepID=A0A8A3PAM6_9HELO|nr:hypothetical protein DSL72_001546 [Monilinia vaccinii-corymbosi]